ncbi:DUF2207 domain-containing protein [Cryomorpha ignava]|uniref:DUF2207 domain-containing protein n=1 Tax=Cryomorpha ignava TaxID=101383 RepID=UPI00293C1182|nr:DUF2207 domain-containing protein [Cryomorpha ignava]
MKKLFIVLLGILFSIQAFSQGFEVNKAHVDISINAEGYFDVVENYDLTFTEYKHGIYRDIQTNYDLLTEENKSEKRKIKIRDIEVPGHNFDADPDFVQKVSDNLRIKIGDKDRTVIGSQHYQIKYRVYNAFLFEKDQIRFYWNVKPNGWDAVFKQIDFTVHLPKNVDIDPKNFFVYSGQTGSTEASNEFDVSVENGTFKAESRENFFSYMGQSVTVLLNLPLGSVAEIKPLWPFWAKYGWTFILGALIILFYFIWKRYGKDDSVVAAISYFPPKEMDPAMAGFLIDDSGDTQDLISLIPYWGSRGYLKMEEIPKSGWFGSSDTRLIKLKQLPADSPVYERTVFNGLFGSSNEILISSLKNKFYTTMGTAKNSLKDKAQVYYDPRAARIKIAVIVSLILLCIGLFFLFLIFWGLLAAIVVIPVSILLLVMSTHLIKKNQKGNEVLSELKGFKQFIKVAEENKLKMLLQESPTYFETTMAYALAFGMFDKWAKKFDGLNLQPPDWYISPPGAFTMNHFANSFSSSISAAKSTMVSSPSSSSSGGGGSSGGGFGGGGGGSW